MKNILLLLSSARGDESYSHKYAKHIVDSLVRRHTKASVTVRDLAKEPLPHVGEAFVGGIFAPADKRTPAQARAVALSDSLIDELMAADVVVMAVPMYNFGLPSTLKAWIDHIARAGRTFAYSEQGPKGLVTGKQAVLVLARGGIYSEGPMKSFDFQETYLRTLLGFIGISDVHVLRVEGTGMGDEAVKRAIDAASEQLDLVQRFLHTQPAPQFA